MDPAIPSFPVFHLLPDSPISSPSSSVSSPEPLHPVTLPFDIASVPVVLLIPRPCTGLVNMDYHALSELKPGVKNWNVCVRVSRLWEYRGGTDTGSVQHVDMVLVDNKGNSMYAEIGKDDLEEKALLLAEGNTYTLTRFMVSLAKRSYKVVQGMYMINFTCHTIVEVVADIQDDFPEFVYDPVPFPDLPAYVGENKRFVDIFGVIVSVSAAASLRIARQPTPTSKRTVVLRDDKNYETKITLWGQRATDFPAQLVIEEGQRSPVSAIFVGMLMRSFQGENFLSGNSACRWYISPNDPIANSLVSSYSERFEPIIYIEGAAEPVRAVVPSNQIQHMTLAQINAMSPYQFPPEGFKCTTVIKNLVPGQTWWFASCNRCAKKSLPHGDGYRCSSCGCSGKKFRFKICIICTDGTAEGEFMLFGDVGEQVVDAQVGALLRAERQGLDFPPEVTAIVSNKYTWNVAITSKSFYKKEKSYEVNSIDVCFGRQAIIPMISLGLSAAPGPLAILPATQVGKGVAQSSNTLGKTPPKHQDLLEEHEAAPRVVEHTPPPNQSNKCQVKAQASLASSARKRILDEATDQPTSDGSAATADGAIVPKGTVPKKLKN